MSKYKPFYLCILECFYHLYVLFTIRFLLCLKLKISGKENDYYYIVIFGYQEAKPYKTEILLNIQKLCFGEVH